MITIIGTTFGIPDTVMGLTFIAAGVRFVFVFEFVFVFVSLFVFVFVMVLTFTLFSSFAAFFGRTSFCVLKTNHWILITQDRVRIFLALLLFFHCHCHEHHGQQFRCIQIDDMHANHHNHMDNLLI